MGISNLCLPSSQEPGSTTMVSARRVRERPSRGSRRGLERGLSRAQALPFSPPTRPAPGARCPNCRVGGRGLCPPPEEAGEHGHVLRLSSANPPSLPALALSPRSPTRGPWRSRACLRGAALVASQLLPLVYSSQDVLRWSSV